MGATDDNPFTRLGLEPRFDLQRAQIERATLQKLARLHPDRSPEDARAAAAVNEARNELLDPERRANALLLLRGGPSASDQKTLPDGFLSEIMMIRMELEQDAASGDQARIDRWHAWARQERDRYAAEASAKFAAEAPASELRTLLNAWRYIERLRDQLPPGSASPGSDVER